MLEGKPLMTFHKSDMFSWLALKGGGGGNGVGAWVICYSLVTILIKSYY